ncbi:hypothetical protein [Mesorhizobium sp. YM1C-6-2]|uniref:hypothetical protein n=1 Tax=Mesorhizobium sp. YM1C-6-2 TaxID=1827501 RepID=UPI0011C41FD6|nr:hypothetical protein [Mesorhizobium sp. YM1C-6-2]
MTTFGTSAYMKLLALNPQPRETEIRKRFAGSKRSYDFHKAMRKIVTEYVSGRVDWSATEARLLAIKKPAERTSAISAAHALMNWINGRPIKLLQKADVQAASPNDIFSVRFSPDFEIEIAGKPTRIHIWNTIRPPIAARESVGMLGLFVSDDAPQSMGVLSLRSEELFLPSSAVRARELAKLLALDIEKRMSRIAAESGTRPSKEDGSERRPEI